MMMMTMRTTVCTHSSVVYDAPFVCCLVRQIKGMSSWAGVWMRGHRTLGWILLSHLLDFDFD